MKDGVLGRCGIVLTILAVSGVTKAKAPERLQWRVAAFGESLVETQSRSGTADSQWAGALGLDAGVWRSARKPSGSGDDSPECGDVSPESGDLSTMCGDVSHEYGFDVFSYYLASESPNGPAQSFVEPRIYFERSFFDQRKASVGAEFRTSQMSNEDGSHFDSTRATILGSWRFLSKDHKFESWRVVPSFTVERYSNRDRSPGATVPNRDGAVTTGALQVRWYKPETLRHSTGSLFRRSRMATSAFLTVSDQIDRSDDATNSRGWNGSLDVRFAHIVKDRIKFRIDVSGGLAHDTFRARQGPNASDWNPTSFGRAAVTIPFGKKAACSVVFAVQHASEPTGDHSTSGSLVVAWDSGRPWKRRCITCMGHRSPDDGASTSTPANTGPTRPIVTRITVPN